MSLNIEEQIQASSYLCSEAEIEQLAQLRFTHADAAKRQDGTYLRILLATMQQKFGKPLLKGRKRKELGDPERKDHVKYLGKLHAAFYVAVLRGVSKDVEDVEGLTVEESRRRMRIRNSRATFARSAASTIRSYIEAGGDIRSLDVEKVTKGWLRTWIIESQGERPSVDAIGLSLKRIEVQAAAMLTENPDLARDVIQQCIARLQHLMSDVQFDSPLAGVEGPSAQYISQDAPEVKVATAA